MKSNSVEVAVLNSLLFINDPRTDNPPEIDGLSAIWSTPSCVAVSCLPDCDGKTSVTIGPGSVVAMTYEPLFDERLNTPSRILVVETVLHEAILKCRTLNNKTRVRIWTNGHRATDRVIIGVD